MRRLTELRLGQRKRESRLKAAARGLAIGAGIGLLTKGAISTGGRLALKNSSKATPEALKKWRNWINSQNLVRDSAIVGGVTGGLFPGYKKEKRR